MEKYIFRNAENSETNEILSLYKNAVGTEFCVWTDSYPGITELKRDLETGNVYVLLDGAKIVGAISSEPMNDMDEFSCWRCNDGTQRELARVVVADGYHGLGIAKMLVNEISGVLSSNGCNTIHLAVAKSNIPAYKTYLGVGFENLGEAEIYGGSYYLMEKLLNPKL